MSQVLTTCDQPFLSGVAHAVDAAGKPLMGCLLQAATASHSMWGYNKIERENLAEPLCSMHLGTYQTDTYSAGSARQHSENLPGQ